jgi:DNA end-binding protein Ku
VVNAVWTGSLSFGLVNVPVKLYPATRPKDVRFHLLDPDTGARIRHLRVSEATGEEVPYERLVKGYEVAPDRHVVLKPEELYALEPEATQTIDVQDFVALDSIDPLHYEHAYYLAPDRGGGKAYALLVRAMREAHKVAIARMVLRTKQYLAAVRPVGDALCLHTMLFADELVATTELEGLVDPGDVGDRELAVARQLIDALATTFEPGKYRDEYRDRVLELIARKAEGGQPAVTAAASEPPGVRDLLAALEASVAQAERARGG